MNTKQISSGAESLIFLDKDKIIKDRIPKSYRISEIDESLRNSRTKREAKVLDRLNRLGINSPKLLSVTDTKIEMSFINGDPAKRLFDKHPLLAMDVGKSLSVMHDNDIIHGDLTTSNMIFKNSELYFIDFGLSFFSKRIEDKAVDIHLFKQALESKHYTVFGEAYESFLKGYSPKDKKEILKRLEEVELRGRNKEKI